MKVCQSQNNSQDSLHPYCNHRHKITEEDRILYKQHRLIILQSESWEIQSTTWITIQETRLVSQSERPSIAQAFQRILRLHTTSAGFVHYTQDLNKKRPYNLLTYLRRRGTVSVESNELYSECGLSQLLPWTLKTQVFPLRLSSKSWSKYLENQEHQTHHLTWWYTAQELKDFTLSW